MPSETDATRSRWPVHPAWRVVQSAFSDDASCEIGSLVFKRTKEVNVRRAVEAVSGYITSIAAQGDDLYPELGQGYDDTMEWLTDAVERNLKVKKRIFHKEVEKKRPRYVRLPESLHRTVEQATASNGSEVVS